MKARRWAIKSKARAQGLNRRVPGSKLTVFEVRRFQFINLKRGCRPIGRSAHRHDWVNFDDRSLYHDDRDDRRIVCGLRDSDRDSGRFDCVAGLAKAKSFGELRSRSKPSLGRPRSSPEPALLRSPSAETAMPKRG